MTRNEVLDDARDTLSVEADCPFAPPSDALVLRCPANRKWFAILLRRAEGELPARCPVHYLSSPASFPPTT